MTKIRFAFAVLTAILTFGSSAWPQRTSTSTTAIEAQDSTLQQPPAAPPADSRFDSALCQIVYQVDQSPSPSGYRYLFYGNGFFVNEDGYVLTAAHVLTELNGGQPYLLLRAKSGPPQFVQADVVAIDHDHDVALLHATPNPFAGKYEVSFLRLATDIPTRGQMVLAAALRPTKPRDSYTGEAIVEQHFQGAVLDFEFSELEDTLIDTELFVFNHSVQTGQSGSAVLSPSTHSVVGIVEGEWMRGALTALAAAKHGPADDDDAELLPGDSSSPVPGAVIPIHYAISVLQQKGIAWHAASEANGNGARSESESQTSTAPVPLSLVPAPFPSQSFFGGEVVLDALVDHSGGVSDVRVIHGEDPFVDKALAAVRTWMFTPARSGGHATESRITIAFEFPQPYIPPRSATVHHYSDDASQWADDAAPVPTSTTEPAYPDPSVKPGSVILYGLVDKTGQLGSIRVVRGAETLTQAALSAAEGWKFEPAMEKGNTVDSAVVIAVSFRQPLAISRTR